MSPDDGRASAGLHRTIPALPVRDVRVAVAHYRAHFGFDAPHETDDFAVLVRDDAVLHLWGATDEDWRSRQKLSEQPICSGAESFLAGTASCRVEVAGVDALFEELEPHGVLHDVSRGGPAATDFGTREFRRRRPRRQSGSTCFRSGGGVRLSWSVALTVRSVTAREYHPCYNAIQPRIRSLQPGR